MGVIAKYGTSSLSSFSDAPEPIYGTGSDGNVTFDGSSTVLSLVPSSGNYTLSRDIFCQNMVVNGSALIRTNGYRVFVKNKLTLDDGAFILTVDGFTTAGSIHAGALAQTSVTHSLGGSGGGVGAGTATAPTAALGGSNYFKQALNAVCGYSINSTGGPIFLRGGAGGSSGAGGGIVIIAARYIECTGGSAFIRAVGGATGGGGGVVLIISSAPELPSNISVNVSGHGTGAPGTYYYIQAV